MKSVTYRVCAPETDSESADGIRSESEIQTETVRV